MTSGLDDGFIHALCMILDAGTNGDWGSSVWTPCQPDGTRQLYTNVVFAYAAHRGAYNITKEQQSIIFDSTKWVDYI
jgi:hypothetical protein